MFGRISRSYDLVCHSWQVLKKDKEIMLFPVLSGLCSIAVAASFVIPLVVLGAASQEQPEKGFGPIWYLLSFLFYLVSYFITIFFNVGVMHCAAIRMDGGDPTVADGFKGAFKHLGAILAWSFVAATVGMILRLIEERAAIIGKIVAAVAGLAWTLLTYFVVPVMIFEGAGVGRGVKRSVELFKKTWGETVVGEAGMGIFFGLLSLLGVIPIILAFYLASTGTMGLVGAILLGSVAVLYWIAIAVIAAALQGIFHVALYRYAATGKVPSGYPEDLVARHWRPKG